MFAPFMLVAAFISSAFAQNVTTTLTTRVPISTAATTIVRSSSTLVSATTAFSLETLLTSYPTATASSTPVPAPITLDTEIGPAFGVLGALLILTGLPSAFWGHKNRWSSFFIIGFYTLSVICLALILRFGVLQAVNPPSETLRGLFVLSCAVAGVVGGGVTVFFWKGTKYFIGGWGGFAFGLFIQCFHNGGLIKPLGLRYVLYIGCGVIGFVLCTIPKLHYHILLISTAFVGASAFMLGVDCYTTAGLKEFYVYNLGFSALFPKFENIGFPVSQTMQIELGMMGAVAIMGAAVQARVLIELRARLREINAEQERRNAETEAKAAARFQEVDKERQQWEMEHGKGMGNSKLEDVEAGRTLTPGSPRASSSLSLFKAQAGRSSMTMADMKDANAPKVERPQSPKLNIDLGGSVAQAMPDDLLAEDSMSTEDKKDPEIKKNLELLSELNSIKQTIASLKSPERPSSFAHGSRSRTQSTGDNLASNTVGSRSRMPGSPSRPTSTPALTEWDNYVSSRSLFQPPSGTSAPVAPIHLPPRPHSISMSPAVVAALESRQRQERAYELGGPDAYAELTSGNGRASRPVSALFDASARQDEEDIPLSHRRRLSSGANSLLQNFSRQRTSSQVLVLPPKKHSPTHSTSQPVVKTFEELESRHREKIRALQDPLTKREAEEAELVAAKQRWERSTAVEKNVMSRKHVEQARTLDQKGQMTSFERVRPHSRSFGTTEFGERPVSTASKVQDWQRYQEATQSRRDSRADMEDNMAGNRRSGSKSPLPFPSANRPPHSRDNSKANPIV